MENRKVILDRAKIASDNIADRQDFNELMKAVKTPPNPLWKSWWFWGGAGIASVSLLLLSKQFLFNNELTIQAYEETPTLAVQFLPEDTECIKAPIQNLDLPFERFVIQPNQDNHIALKDGSRIFVPANSLVVSGSEPVEIWTRTFLDKAEAFIAGIPMDYQDGAFESAGMIEIRGYQNGKQVSIRPDKPIEVSLALFKDPKGFDFYALDDQTGKWTIYPCEYSNPQVGANEQNEPVNSKELQLKKEVAVLKGQIIQVTEQLEKDVDPTRADYYIHENEQRIFSLNYDKRDFPELAQLGNIKFEALPKQPNFENIFKRSWSDFKITEKEGKYTVTFSDRTSKEVIAVRPVLTGEDLKKAMKRYNEAIEDTNESRKIKQMELERLRAESEHKNKMLRTIAEDRDKMATAGFSQEQIDASVGSTQKTFVKAMIGMATAEFRTTSFGVFNSDHPIGYPDPMKEHVIFAVAGKTVVTKEIYLFDLKRDVRFTFGTPNKSIQDFGLTNNEQVIMVILEDNSMAYARTTRKDAKSDGVIRLFPIKMEDVSVDVIKSIIHEERVSA